MNKFLWIVAVVLLVMNAVLGIFDVLCDKYFAEE